MNKCIGCGIKLQNTDKDKIGYTKDLSNKYCERCFKTIHYNEERVVKNLDNKDIVNKINKLKYFTIFITDLININEKLINIYKSINNNKVFVINKCDIIPDNLKLEHLEDNIKNVYGIDEDIFFISAKNKMYLNRIYNLITENNNVIICGETSSGKSTLINNLTNSNLTTSKYNNTTLDFIKIKIDNNFIYDTPGMMINTGKKVFDDLIIRTKRIDSKYVYNINDILLGGIGNLTFVMYKNIDILSKTKKMELPKVIKVSPNSDIILDGIGFIYTKDEIKLESNIDLEIRKSIIGR